MVSRPSRSYPAELKGRAVRMVAEVRAGYRSEWAVAVSVAAKLQVGSAQTLLSWVRKSQVDAGERPGRTSEESAGLRRLRAENRELRRANEIVKAASSFFAAERDRPHKCS